MRSSRPPPRPCKFLKPTRKKRSCLAMIKTSPGGMVLLVRSVFLIYTAYEWENPFSRLQGLARCHEKALWSLWLPCPPDLPPLPFCDLTCTFWLQGVTFSAGNPVAVGSNCVLITEKRTAALVAVKPSPPHIREPCQAAGKSPPLLRVCIPVCTISWESQTAAVVVLKETRIERVYSPY